MLELDDIQHILLTRAPAMTGRYEFLSFKNAAAGRAWLEEIRGKVHSAASARASVEADRRWITVAFTWNGLRALGLDETSLATFPEEFRQGIVARSTMLGDTGESHPDKWVGGLASPDLHAIVILFARDEPERARCQAEHERLLARCAGVTVLSTLDLQATPPFDYAHDHFGYRDRMSQPAIEGSGEESTPEVARRSNRASSSWLPRRERAAIRAAPARRTVAERQLHGLPAAGRARWKVPGFPESAGEDGGRARAHRRQVDGPVAERRAAGARPGAGRSCAGRRSEAE
jgi:hypothetical protein